MSEQPRDTGMPPSYYFETEVKTPASAAYTRCGHCGGLFQNVIEHIEKWHGGETQVRKEALEEAAQIAEKPYSDEVKAFGNDEPSVVGGKITAAIRALAASEPGRETK